MRTLTITLANIGLLGSLVGAFPRLQPDVLESMTDYSKRAVDCPYAAINKPEKRQNGFDPTTQKVSTTGGNAWVAPNFAAGDQRGPCPGLNALANHGYLPHNGVADIPTIISAVNTAYGMALDLAQFLAVYGTLFDGNAVSLDPGYSIGGPTTSQQILGGLGLLGTPTGLSGSHNNYEGDSSPTRGDLYTTGNDYLLQVNQFQQYYDALLDNNPAPQQYEALFNFRQSRFNDSISTNPYFFFPAFAGVLVTPAGYAFPPAMMANHSAQYPDGYLDKETFKSFFAITGQSGSFQYQAGHERIPDNWYKRPVGDGYTIPGFISDVLKFGLRDPRLLSIGGNTGTPNSFTGLDISALTQGVYNSATLTQGNNLQCFIFQLIQSEAPGLLTTLYENVTAAVGQLTGTISKDLSGLGCPKLSAVDNGQYGMFPGFGRAKGY